MTVSFLERKKTLPMGCHGYFFQQSYGEAPVLELSRM